MIDLGLSLLFLLSNASAHFYFMVPFDSLGWQISVKYDQSTM